MSARWLEVDVDDWDSVPGDPPRRDRGGDVILEELERGVIVRQRIGTGADRRWLWCDSAVLIEDPDAADSPESAR